MRPSAVLVLLACLSSCFSPSYPADLECGPDDFCPPGQRCTVDKICVLQSVSPTNPDAQPAPDAGPDLGELQAIDIGPDLSLPLADDHTFVVTATYEQDTRVENNALVIWRSSDTATVFVDFQGIAKPQALGTAKITADFNGRVDSVEVTVVP